MGVDEFRQHGEAGHAGLGPEGEIGAGSERCQTVSDQPVTKMHWHERQRSIEIAPTHVSKAEGDPSMQRTVRVDDTLGS